MDLLFYLALVPTLGVIAQWLAWRTNLPGILLLLLFGVALGQVVNPDQYLAALTGGDQTAGSALLFPLVSLAVAVIMFEGGLSLKFNELRVAGTAALRLCTLGAAITFLLAALAASWTLRFDWRLCLLLGAILTVTGPTVIGPLLRQVRPSRRVASTLKWEGIVIDPIGAVLAVLVFDQLMKQSQVASLGHAALMFLQTAGVGIVLGVVGGAAMSLAFRRFWLPDNLHGVGALSLGLLLFAVSDHLAHESGLITVTVIGIWLTNQDDFDVEHIIEFKENLRTLLIGCLFIVLGSRVDLHEIAAVGFPGLAFLATLILLVRPVSVFISLLGSPLSFREQTFVAYMAPRGIVAAAVSSVFALKLQRDAEVASLIGANQLDTVTFLIIVGTVAVYGLAAMPLAKTLGLAETSTNGVLIAGADAWIRDFALQLRKADLPVLLVDTNYGKISSARVAGLEAVCANILNEHVRDDLPLNGIGQLLAMTENDEINSLAVRECRHIFGRARLYQLSFNEENMHYRRGLTKNLMGRALFGTEQTFSHLREMHEAGATFKSTTLSDSFSYQDFLDSYGQTTTLMCVIGDDKSLKLNTVAERISPVAGQTVISLVASTPVPDDHVAKHVDETTDV